VPNKDHSRFGELLRQHRLASGLTQADLAEQAAMSVRGIQDLELGVSQPHRDTLQRLLDALQLSASAAAVLRHAAAPRPRRRMEKLDLVAPPGVQLLHARAVIASPMR
jgi:transcriptional regulator with XRE-family HTH domain